MEFGLNSLATTQEKIDFDKLCTQAHIQSDHSLMYACITISTAASTDQTDQRPKAYY